MNLIEAAANERGRAAFVHLLLLTLVVACASCRRSEVAGNANAVDAAGKSAPAGETFTSPPFSTKEPERFQARMVTEGRFGEGSNLPGTPEIRTAEELITRDGEKRRVDRELSGGMKVSYLQLSSGLYLLVHEKKIYAEVKVTDEGGEATSPKSVPADFSPDKLLNQSPGGARYEKLGTEDVNGRATVKYRVTIVENAGAADSRTTENLMWIDESLGMPVKSEMITTGANYGSAKYSMEMRDIKQDFDPSFLELPTDYKKVDYKELTRQIKDSALNSKPNQAQP